MVMPGHQEEGTVGETATGVRRAAGKGGYQRETPGGRGGGDRQLERWQQKLMPVMVAVIAVMAVFFFAASLWQLEAFREDSRVTALELPKSPDARLGTLEERDQARWNTLVALESHLIMRRYEQVRSLLLLRAWTRYVGFLTGMILAFVGSVFVLGKLGEGGPAQELAGEGSGVKATLKTPYPGVVLAALGTVLMGMTIAVPFDFETRDIPVYLAPMDGRRSQPLPDPPAFPVAAKIPSTVGSSEAPPAVQQPPDSEEQELFGNANPAGLHGSAKPPQH